MSLRLYLLRLEEARSMSLQQIQTANRTPADPRGPFRHRPFAVLWTATVISNVGTWMQNAAAGWLMTGLNPDPLVVALVQVATAMPMFLFAIPAGALADIFDRRRLLIAVQIVLTLLVAAFGILVWTERVTPLLTLIFTFLAGTAAALIVPTWQAIVPQLVPRQELTSAVAANSAGFNISRAVGPAIGGLIINQLGLAAPFWINALSNLIVIAALIWWRPPRQSGHRLPAERFGSAIRVGLRHARANPHLRATLLHGVGFFVFASAYWALLPLIAHDQIKGGPDLYGILLGAIGASAVIGAFLLPRFTRRFGPDRVVAAGTLGTAISLALFGLARSPPTALLASFIAGLSWIAVLATINVSAQLALPGWVRGRGLSIFTTVLFGGLSFGSVAWGQTAAVLGLPAAHFIAAAGLIAVMPLMSRWKLQTGAEADLTPSMHWPAPVLAQPIDPDRGPVLVTVEYRIRPEDREAFLDALCEVSFQRKRDGAFEWGVFEDTAEPGRMVEAFLVPSWLEHLRQHQRVTQESRVLEERVEAFHIGPTKPVVTHLVAAVTPD
jgi:MFS family permease